MFTYNLTIRFSLFVLLIVMNLYMGSIEKYKVISIGSVRTRFTTKDIVAVLLLILLAVLAAQGIDNPDFKNYELSYSSSTDLFENGFSFLQNIARGKGLSFEVFRTLVCCASLLFMWLAFRKFQIESSISLAIYAIFPFVYDATQLRNWFAFSVIFLFLPDLIFDNKKGVVKFILAVVIATSIHTLSLVYLLFLLLKFESKSKSKNRILGLAFVSSLVLLMLTKLSGGMRTRIISIIYQATNEMKGLHYTNQLGGWGFVIYLLFEVLFILSAYFAYKTIWEDNLIDENDRYRQLSKSILDINIAISCTFPLLAINTVFFRMFRNIYIINAIIPMMMVKMRPSTKKKLALLLFGLGFIFSIIWSFREDGTLVFWCYFD